MTRQWLPDYWRDLAASVVAEFPLAATDWDQHSDAVESGLYSVRECRKLAAPATAPLHFFADEPPLSPEEEEHAYALSMASSQMELF